MTASGAKDGRAGAGPRAAASAALEVLLTDAAVGGRKRLVPPRAAPSVIRALARRPDVVARRAGALAYSEWLGERSGALRRPPLALGNRRHKPLAAAPGSYVHAG